MAIAVSFEVNAAQLRDVLSKLEPDQYRLALADVFTDSALVLEGEVKKKTPVVTGNLRRSIVSDVRSADRWPDPEVRVLSREEYANWVETGERRDGARMRSPSGGHRMFQGGAESMERKLPKLLDEAALEIEARWAA